MVCYRRHGHNEGDEPAFTQPIMYKKIKEQPTTREIYAAQLVEEGSLTQAETDQINTDFLNRLETDFRAATGYKPNKADWLEGRWQGLEVGTGAEDRNGQTGVELALLQEVGKGLTTVPADFNLNPENR